MLQTAAFVHLDLAVHLGRMMNDDAEDADEIDINDKVNRCLARYSPRATTTNRPTNRALNKPAWPGPN